MAETLEEQLEIARDELRMLERVSSLLNASLELDRIYETLLQTMDELFGFHTSAVYLLADGGTELTLVARRGEGSPAIGTQVRVGQGLVGSVAQQQEIMRLSILVTGAAGRRSAGRLESQMGIPMRVEGKLMGVFAVQSLAEHAFRKRDERLVSILANQAATAIQNALLYRSVRERGAELSQAHDRLQQLNEELEQRVRQRTLELERSNRELQETQAQLVQSGKLAALGQLSAGVAHEVNTPLGAIMSNADVAQRALARLRQVLEREEFKVLLGEEPRVGRALDVLSDTNRVTLDAAGRVSAIVDHLRSFARLDRAAQGATDLEQGLDSTLSLIPGINDGRIELIRDYAGLPTVRCYGSELHQVFMIVLNNAVEAIDAPGRIKIKTSVCGERVRITVWDTGRGMSKEQCERAFDPGYTTKGAGVGTGLGLSIAYRIMERHHGSIVLSSEPQQGTTVTLELPLEPLSG